MTKLARFFATCLLVLSLSAVAFAGDIQGPGDPVEPPPPPGEIQGPGMAVSAPNGDTSVVQTSTTDTTMRMLYAGGELLTDWYLAIF